MSSKPSPGSSQHEPSHFKVLMGLYLGMGIIAIIAGWLLHDMWAALGLLAGLAVGTVVLWLIDSMIKASGRRGFVYPFTYPDGTTERHIGIKGALQRRR